MKITQNGHILYFSHTREGKREKTVFLTFEPNTETRVPVILNHKKQPYDLISVDHHKINPDMFSTPPRKWYIIKTGLSQTYIPETWPAPHTGTGVSIGEKFSARRVSVFKDTPNDAVLLDFYGSSVLILDRDSKLQQTPHQSALREKVDILIISQTDSAQIEQHRISLRPRFLITSALCTTTETAPNVLTPPEIPWIISFEKNTQNRLILIDQNSEKQILPYGGIDNQL
ncbi:hypothetical protein CHISP_3379 [Chitinispirillum alkaliphilum]|nr:hypothetical protein CHISP_3379 [Chitinispirillum alkaliphilum]